MSDAEDNPQQPQQEFHLVRAAWTANIPEQTAEERGLAQTSLAPNRTRFVISCSIMVFHEGSYEMFDRGEINLVNFAIASLGCARSLIRAAYARRNRIQKYLKVFVDFNAPYDMMKQPAFFVATYTLHYTTHKEESSYHCRLEQPKIEEYLDHDDYDQYMTVRYGAQRRGQGGPRA